MNLRQCYEALELHGLALCKGAHALHALLIVLRGRTRTVQRWSADAGCADLPRWWCSAVAELDCRRGGHWWDIHLHCRLESFQQIVHRDTVEPSRRENSAVEACVD
jgi:hypothetical protein